MPPFIILNDYPDLFGRDDLNVEVFNGLAIVVNGLVQDALTLGDDGRDQGLASNVDRSAAHIKDRIDRQQEADAFERQAEG